MNAKVIIVAIIMVLMTIVAYAEEPARLIPREVEKAALAGNWEQIANLLKDVDSNSDSPVKRLVKGHACLAMNRNNESFCLFASATSADLILWENWSSYLVKEHPKNSYAHFYRADALGRLENYEGAVAEFTKAIELDGKNAYAFHGRGVLYAQMGNYDEAGKNIDAAQRTASNIADFYNSRGMLRIAQQKGNIVRLEQQFIKATKLSKDFGLAQHALGCVKLLRNPSADVDTIDQLQQAYSTLPEGSQLFANNETAYEKALIDKMATTVAAAAEDAKAGMAIKREITLGKLSESYRSRKDAIGNLRDFDKAVAQHGPSWAGGYRMDDIAKTMESKVREMSPQEVQDFARKNPQTAHTLADAITSRRNTLSQTVVPALPQVARHIDRIGLDLGKVSGDLNMGRIQTGLNNAAQKMSHDRLNLAVKVNQLRGAELYRRSEHGPGTTTPDNYRGTIQRFSPGPAIKAQQGGATTDKRHVVWSDEPWPFRPIYGLLYLPKSNTVVGDVKTRREPDLNQK